MPELSSAWRRIRDRLSRTTGAIDLASIMVGVIIIGIIAGVLSATVFLVIPWSQDHAAQESIRGVKDAESVARVEYGTYLSTADLVSRGFLPSKMLPSASAGGDTILGGRGASVAPRLVVSTPGEPAQGIPGLSVSDDGGCYVTAVQSPTGNVYWLSSDNPDVTPVPSDATTAPDTSACASFPDVSSKLTSTSTPLAVTYPTQAFSKTVPSQQLALPTVSNRLGTLSYACKTASGGACAAGTADWPSGATFNTANGQFTGPANFPYQVKQISADNNHGCLVTVAGGVKCWGAEGGGILGDGIVSSTLKASSPKDVPGLTTGVTKVSTGEATCALATDGSVTCWGSNTGNGDGADHLTPTQVSGLSGVVDIAASPSETCAVLGTGGVRCWGMNSYGSLGTGTIISGYRYTPQTVVTSTGAEYLNAAKVFAGDNNAWCVLTKTGGIDCWGNNLYGGLGDGTTTAKAMPTPVPGLSSGVTSVSLSSLLSCAVMNGDSYCWTKQAGVSPTGSTSGVPVKVPLPETSSYVRLGSQPSSAVTGCIVSVTGTARCWGSNAYGQALLGNAASATTPTVATVLPAGTTDLAMTANITYVIDNTGKVTSFGYSGSNELLGDGSGNGNLITRTGVAIPYTGGDPAAGYPVTVTVTVTDSGAPGRQVSVPVQLSVN